MLLHNSTYDVMPARGNDDKFFGITPNSIFQGYFREKIVPRLDVNSTPNFHLGNNNNCPDRDTYTLRNVNTIGEDHKRDPDIAP